MAPRITVTTVLYNSADTIEECFRSLQPSVENGFAEVIAVDNASPDDSAAIVSEKFPGVKLLKSETNLGFAGGCNLAWESAQGDYWFLFNPDAVISDEKIRKIVEWMDQRPEVGIASPDIIDDRDSSAFPGRRFPSIVLTLTEMSRLHLLLPIKTRGDLMLGTYWNGGDQLNADWVPGTAMIVRRKLIEQIGLLSDRLFIYGEDIEWCWRAKQAGWKVGVCSSVKIYHQGGTSAKRTWKTNEINLRMYDAIYKAIELMRGKTYSRALLALDSAALFLEAYHPFRPKDSQRRVRKLLKSHLSLLFSGKSVDFNNKPS